MIGYALSDAHFDWMVGSVSTYTSRKCYHMYLENFDQEVNKQQFPSFAGLFLRTINFCKKAIEDIFQLTIRGVENILNIYAKKQS